MWERAGGPRQDLRDVSVQVVVGEVDVLELLEGPKRGWDASVEKIGGEVERPEVREAAHLGRDGTPQPARGGISVSDFRDVGVLSLAHAIPACMVHFHAKVCVHACMHVHVSSTLLFAWWCAHA